jgi:hypothetical protein
MQNVLRLNKSYREFSAGTLFLQVEKDQTEGMLKVKALSSQLVSKRSGRLHRPELMIPIGYLDDYKSHTFIVPAINGRERRKRTRVVLKAIKES